MASPPRKPRSKGPRPHGRAAASGEGQAPRKDGPRPGRRDDARARKRAAGGEGWLYGRHPVEAALANPERRLRTVLATPDALQSIQPLLDARNDLPVVDTVERAVLDDMLPPGAVHQGLALLAEPLPALAVEDVIRMTEAETNAVVIVLDQVTDPHNVGAVLRSAAAFGAVAVITQERHAPEETAVLAKSASGALERVPLVRVPNLKHALETLKAANWWTAGLAADAPVTLAGAKLSGKTVLILGSEGTGMRRLTREACDHLVRLPMMPDAIESLNVSNAAAVGLYELRRTALEGGG